MPVKLGSKLPPENAEARIEIIPLIDIMFFLLAAFMLVSLSMVTLKSVKVNLPTATTATQETQRDLVNISVDKTGLLFLDQKPIEARVFISGDRDARHGDVVRALDLVRSAGIERVAFEIREPENGAPASPR
jgi:biopolymer transport protein ExbD